MPHEDPDISEERTERLREFTEIYIQKYRDSVEEEADAEGLPSEHLPMFYQAFPYKVQWYIFDNDTAGGVFLKGDEAALVAVTPGEFHEVRWILEDRACLRFIPLDNMEKATPGTAERMAARDAEQDVEMAKKRRALASMKKELENLEKQITDMVKVNPWLEDRAASQLTTLSTTKNMISSLEMEIETAEDKRFASYLSALDDLELMPPTSIREEEKRDLEDISLAAVAGVAATAQPGEKKEDIVDLEAPPTLASIQEEAEEEEEEPFEPPVQRPPPPAEPRTPPPKKPPKKKIPARAKKPEEKPSRPAFVEVKTQPVRPKMEKMARLELPPEIKNTIFRMNRRLYNLEKKVEPIDRFYTREIKKMRDDTILLQKDVERSFARNRTQMEEFQRKMYQEMKKLRKQAVGLGVGAVILALIAILIALRDVLSGAL
ncbi:MAG: hypothetical protein J7L61_02550 [Thermoplasmata archaeon]|nr:hypothetical protein [Thermoplasmata archaeon]